MSDPAPRPSPAPLPAASLILLRDGSDGMEVLVGRRHAATRAFPGATAFPGGKLERHDAERLEAGAGLDYVARYAAIRETFEETGLLISDSGEGSPPGVDVAVARAAVEAGGLRFAELLARWGVTPGSSRLTAFARWITPQGAPYRFDTAFFLVQASASEAQARLICSEFEHLRWATPQALLREEGRRLMTPTRYSLGVLAQSATSADALEAARARGPIDGEIARGEACG